MKSSRVYPGGRGGGVLKTENLILYDPAGRTRRGFLKTFHGKTNCDFSLQVDWSEKWLWAVMGFHLLCFGLTLLSLRRMNVQAFLFLFFCKSIFCVTMMVLTEGSDSPLPGKLLTFEKKLL